MLERMWRKKNSLPSGGHENWPSYSGEKYGNSSKTKNRATIEAAVTLLGLYLEKTLIPKIHAPQWSQQHCFQQPNMEAIYMSINRCINKMHSIQIHGHLYKYILKYYSDIKKRMT